MSDWMIIPSDEDIEHGRFHKYIDKIRTASGKWRYIYERSNNLRRKVKQNKKMRERAVNHILEREKKGDLIGNELIKSARHGNKEDVKKYSEMLNKIDLEQEVTRESFSNYMNDMHAIADKYYDTPIGKWEEKHPMIAGFILDLFDELQRRG